MSFESALAELTEVDAGVVVRAFGSEIDAEWIAEKLWSAGEPRRFDGANCRLNR